MSTPKAVYKIGGWTICWNNYDMIKFHYDNVTRIPYDNMETRQYANMTMHPSTLAMYSKR